MQGKKGAKAGGGDEASGGGAGRVPLPRGGALTLPRTLVRAAVAWGVALAAVIGGRRGRQVS